MYCERVTGVSACDPPFIGDGCEVEVEASHFGAPIGNLYSLNLLCQAPGYSGSFEVKTEIASPSADASGTMSSPFGIPRNDKLLAGVS